MTTKGYIKRIPSDTYKTQNRGGKGVKGMAVNEDDIIDQFLTLSTHDDLLLFTNKGKVYRIRGYKVPMASRVSKGIPVVNLLDLQKDECVKAMVALKDSENIDNEYLFFVTKEGLVKRTGLSEFKNIRQSGKIAITLKEEDELVCVKQTTGDDEIIIAGSNGKAVRFKEQDVRAMGRTASGVKGFNCDGSVVIGMTTDKEGKYILAVTEKGFGKKSDLDEYRITSRGAKGVKTVNITEKNGALVSLLAVNGDEDCMIMTDDGIVIRINLSTVSVLGRTTQGVRLIRPAEGTKVSSVAIVNSDEEKTSEEE